MQMLKRQLQYLSSLCRTDAVPLIVEEAIHVVD